MSYELCPDCGKHIEIGDWPYGCAGMGHAPGPFYTGDAQLHDSDKVVIDYNPRTNVTHIPGRADKPMHPKKAADGFIRKTLDTISDIKRFEKSSGKISEAVHYYKNSHRAEKDTNSR